MMMDHDATPSQSRALYRRACRVMPGGNTRTTLFHAPHPRYAIRGTGCRVHDADGHVLIDAINNYTAMIHGHGHPAITGAVARQLELGTCFGLPTETEIALAELLLDRLPHMDHIRFANSGTEAVMTAIKAARAFTGRPAIAKCEGAYHGTYDFAEVSEGTTPATWGPPEAPAAVATARGTPDSALSEVVVIPFNRPDLAEPILRRHAARLAAILIDPMPNRAGLIPAEPEFLDMLRRVADETGCLLILDEVISFRLGYRGAQGRFGVRPDLTCLGKIIGGGFPVGAVAGRAEVMAVFDPSRGRPAVSHGGTFSANPVTMVAGHAAMVLLDPAAFAKLEGLGGRLRAGLDAVLRLRQAEGQVTGMGSLARIHFTSAPLLDYRSTQTTEAAAARMKAVHLAMLDEGVLIAPTGLMALSTAMEPADVDRIIEGFERALARIQAAA